MSKLVSNIEVSDLRSRVFKKRKKRQQPVRRVAWYELGIVRAAGVAALIILAGYLASISVAVHGVQIVTKMAFDREIEELLTSHLDSIKQTHKLKQKIFVHRLERVIPASFRVGGPEVPNVEKIQKWMILADVKELTGSDTFEVTSLSDEEYENAKIDNDGFIAWQNQASLRLHRFLIKLPMDHIKKPFDAAQEAIFRYQGIRATWGQQIKPTLVRILIGILLLTAVLIIGLLVFLAHWIKRKMDDLLDGFIVWSEDDQSFRFSGKWLGEFKMITRQFNQMADEVEVNRRKSVYLEKMSSWQIIARKMAHEIKNPLTPIQMMVSQVVRRYKGDDTEYKLLLESSHNIISEEVNGLRRMVDNFSKFAQLPEPKRQIHDMVTLCSQVTELQGAACEIHDIKFTSDRSELIMNIDPQLIKQVLINLLKNAAEACGEVRSIIRVQLLATDDICEIAVIDNGPGIPGELSKRVFEAYFTTKHTGPSPGMGLGLAICQKIILDHNGDMSIDSTPGNTVFTVRLPIKQKGLQNV